MRPRTDVLLPLLFAATLAGLSGCGSTPKPKSIEPIMRPSTDLIGKRFDAPFLVTHPTRSGAVTERWVTVVEFGTTSCVGCAKLAPGFDRLVASHPGGNVRLVHVFDGRVDSEEDVAAYRSSHQVVRDPEGELFERYGVKAYPSVFVVDDLGKIVWWEATARIELIEEWVTDTMQPRVGTAPN